MNRNEIIDAQLESGSGDGQNYFRRGSFRLEYSGTNKDGTHEDFIDIIIYEHYSDENVNSTNFHEPLLKYLCKPQFQADIFPFSKIDPDFVHDLYEFGLSEQSCSILIWDSKAAALEIDLKPVYDISKLLFVYSKWTETVSVHEAHILCRTIPL